MRRSDATRGISVLCPGRLIATLALLLSLLSLTACAATPTPDARREILPDPMRMLVQPFSPEEVIAFIGAPFPPSATGVQTMGEAALDTMVVARFEAPRSDVLTYLAGLGITEPLMPASPLLLGRPALRRGGCLVDPAHCRRQDRQLQRPLSAGRQQALQRGAGRCWWRPGDRLSPGLQHVSLPGILRRGNDQFIGRARLVRRQPGGHSMKCVVRWLSWLLVIGSVFVAGGVLAGCAGLGGQERVRHKILCHRRAGHSPGQRLVGGVGVGVVPALHR
ncbi:MAG: hypothetical protein HZY76_11660 [Anaerolineae bacterium]|nr:MAG: hypothetical protein HZY76_11660 [Anaerolineae bacterium]